MSDEILDSQPAPISKDKKLQDEINSRESERLDFLCRRFQDFLEPRTQDIEEDEENLIKAYDFYCKINEVVKNAEEEKSNAFLRSMELSSPLCRRDDYTLGDDMAFLRLWFLQNNPDADVVPEFIRSEDGAFFLIFTERELWVPSGFEKEILRALSENESTAS